MGDRIRVTWQDLSVGRKLPWNVYTDSGKLLLSAGHVIPSEQVLNNMRQYVLYRDEAQDNYGNSQAVQSKQSPFVTVQEFVQRLDYIFQNIEAADADAGAKLGRLVVDLIAMCDAEPDAVIATVHLPNNYPYSVFHSIQCAVLCCLIGRHLQLAQQELQMMCGAALTANVSMRQLQDQLFAQGGRADREQKAAIKQHPQRSVEMIRAAGIENPLCQEIVMMHHERTSGFGYPAGLRGGEIVRGALILAVADRYGAMVTMRKYREPVPVKDSLKSFLLGEGKEYDETYSLLLIKVLSVFPPGSFVRLQNGETAIVLRRGKNNPMLPFLKSITGADGQRFSNPLLRDCSLDDYRIAGVCNFDAVDRLNLNKLWDYL
ncbi:MAG: hypothetical protein OEZ39_01815 [Gammaproteobacteria bacterium]|nr:hypothetical protein [Gammaproteobacteria bacterium]MDH5650590.1 hypothetical protein [Gammaproteobacteria bacterium]